MTSTSLWMSTEVLRADPLDGDAHCDVAVIGSGIAGISTAYELARRKLSVIVVDRGGIAQGMTSRTTAHLSPQCDNLMSELKKLRGLDMANAFYRSQIAAVARIEEIQAEEEIDCDFRRLPGYLFLGHGDKVDTLDGESEVMRDIGVALKRLDGTPLPGCGKRPTLRYAGQATFHPLKYLAGVVRACQKMGVQFFADTAVDDVDEGDGSVHVKTARGTIVAGKAVVATNSPISDRFALHTKMAPYRTYAMTFTIARDAIPDALYWDTEEPYHYVRLQPGDKGDKHDFVIVGGEDHKSGDANDADKRFARLEKWARPLIPDLQQVTHRWSGQVLETIDHCAFIGRDPGSEHIYVHTGDSGQGMTHGVAGALLNTALIVDGSSPWQEIYAPDRKTVRGLGNYLKENFTALKNLSEYVAPGEVKSVDELPPDQGAILRHGLQKIAAYRDREGTLHLHSAACTHVGCHLHWNGFETCWDCPCHGSMFDVNGQPLNAPATSALKKVEID